MSRLHHGLNQIYPSCDEVDLHGTTTKLVGLVAELKVTLKDEKKGSHKVDISRETSSLSALVSRTQLEEEKDAHSRKLKVF